MPDAFTKGQLAEKEKGRSPECTCSLPHKSSQSTQFFALHCQILACTAHPPLPRLLSFIQFNSQMAKFDSTNLTCKGCISILCMQQSLFAMGIIFWYPSWEPSAIPATVYLMMITQQHAKYRDHIHESLICGSSPWLPPQCFPQHETPLKAINIWRSVVWTQQRPWTIKKTRNYFFLPLRLILSFIKKSAL